MLALQINVIMLKIMLLKKLFQYQLITSREHNYHKPPGSVKVNNTSAHEHNDIAHEHNDIAHEHNDIAHEHNNFTQ